LTRRPHEYANLGRIGTNLRHSCETECILTLETDVGTINDVRTVDILNNPNTNGDGANFAPHLERDLARLLPREMMQLDDPQTAIPALARNPTSAARIEDAVKLTPTKHLLFHGDSREFDLLDSESIHLVLTSPPYWTLKKYRDHPQQLGAISDYEAFLDDLDKVWRHCFRALVPGGRLICVVGDVCLSRRKNEGRHTVVPLHSSIQERCRRLGFDNLAPIIWHKIANAAYEVENGSRRTQ
jgi:hypothetical protein